jgi:hypothetical protein
MLRHHGFSADLLSVIWLASVNLASGVSSMPSSAPSPSASSLALVIPVVPLPLTLTTLPAGSPSQAPSLPTPWLSDNGTSYGNVTIINNCDYLLNVASVGARLLNGNINATGTKEDEVLYPIPAGTNYSESYRITCPTPVNKTKGYCWSMDKLYGQGVALKISKNATIQSDIFQFEYALIKNPNTTDTFQRLEYDVSLLDCGNPLKDPSAYGNKTDLIDISATEADYRVKVARCPGFKGGISVGFPADKGGLCPRITCDGKGKCVDVYNFDRTREKEPSKHCEGEYVGDTVVALCE